MAADLPATNPLALLIGVASLLTVVALRRWAPRVPGILVAITAAIAAVAMAGWQGQVPMVGEDPSGVPVPALPHIVPTDVLDLLGARASVALSVFASSLLTVSALARPDREPAVPNASGQRTMSAAAIRSGRRCSGHALKENYDGVDRISQGEPGASRVRDDENDEHEDGDQCPHPSWHEFLPVVD